jgi:predicted GNAT family acetyltransferase
VRQHFMLRCDTPPSTASEAPAGTVLEPAGPEDAEAILDLYHACGFEARSPDEMRRAMRDGRHEHAVARVDGRVVAFSELETHWPLRVWVAFVGVVGELRDRGLGSALVAWTLTRRFESGTTSAMLMLSLANRTALRAYEKVGFRRHRVVDVLEKHI